MYLSGVYLSSFSLKHIFKWFKQIGYLQNTNLKNTSRWLLLKRVISFQFHFSFIVHFNFKQGRI